MSRRTIFRRAARDDVRGIRRWYDACTRSDVAVSVRPFIQSLEVCVAQIERTPEIWPRVDEETRRGRLRRFPYVVYYELHGDDVVVLAVWHGHRDPEAWRERQ